jgi:2-amino-4-hydroxy-6-hydroxymethyldihydropteridine diphosphokinase
MIRYLLSFGSSLPGGAHYLQQACLILSNHKYIQLKATSRLIDNEAIDTHYSGFFINMVAAIHSSLPPQTLLAALGSIEHRLGRIRAYEKGPRTLDLDILWSPDIDFYSQQLTLPHPAFTTRAFAYVLSKEVARQVMWPIPFALERLPKSNTYKTHRTQVLKAI